MACVKKVVFLKWMSKHSSPPFHFMPRLKTTVSPEKKRLYEHLCSQSILRSMKSSAEKSDYLNRIHGFKPCELIRLKVCTKRVWDRLAASRKLNRLVGVRGRPRLLKPEDEDTLVKEAIIQAQSMSPLTVKNATSLILNFLFNFVYSLFNL